MTGKNQVFNIGRLGDTPDVILGLRVHCSFRCDLFRPSFSFSFCGVLCGARWSP